MLAQCANIFAQGIRGESFAGARSEDEKDAEGDRQVVFFHQTVATAEFALKRLASTHLATTSAFWIGD